VCIFKFLRITYEIRRWRYTKFAKIWALSEGAPKKISRLAIARHADPPIDLFIIPTLGIFRLPPPPPPYANLCYKAIYRN